MIGDYAAFLGTKRFGAPAAGLEVPGELHPALFDFQRDLTRWALRKGRSAIFADTGLGKTLMQLVWAQRAAERTLILAPLAVSRQTVREGARWGIPVTYAKDQNGAAAGITITNYERLGGFDPSEFGAVVLDESGILKNYAGATRNAIIEAFADTPMRLACTATPAPNDIAELANHAEFLGVMTRAGMLATFFVHDQDGWRLKKPAREPFYKWLASWGMHLKSPADLGYDASAYILPDLDIQPVYVPSDYTPEGQLFATKMHGIADRSAVRRGTMGARVARAVELIEAEPDEPWIVWCGLNDEAALIASLVPDAVNVQGSDDPDVKADRLEAFAEGRIRVLVSKVRVAGMGMNFQHCARQVFVGLGDSYEQYYQAIRRCWRFGQTRPVRVSIVLSDLEGTIYENVLRKETEAIEMSDQIVKHVAEYERTEVHGQAAETDAYAPADASGNGWRMMLGDSCERLADVEAGSVGLSVFSPPFLSLFQYSNTARDLGNAQNPAAFWQHFDWISRELLRVMMPGRNVCVHVAQVATTLAHHGVIGLQDFRGDTIRHFQGAGFVYHGEVCIDKDPQAQAIRTHAKGLLFVQKDKDSSWSRPGLADYILVFRAPGENAVPITPDVSNDEWIEYARPIWYGIRESDTLNAAEGRDSDDERHICALQLGTIERCVRLWSNPGELVLSPFAGIGSEGYEAVRLARRFVGCELKESYFRAACKNLARAERLTLGDLFAWAADNENGATTNGHSDNGHATIADHADMGAGGGRGRDSVGATPAMERPRTAARLSRPGRAVRCPGRRDSVPRGAHAHGRAGVGALALVDHGWTRQGAPSLAEVGRSLLTPRLYRGIVTLRTNDRAAFLRSRPHQGRNP